MVVLLLIPFKTMPCVVLLRVHAFQSVRVCSVCLCVGVGGGGGGGGGGVGGGVWRGGVVTAIPDPLARHRCEETTVVLPFLVHCL